MSQSNGFSYRPHFRTSAAKRGSSSYQELSNGYNKLYQPQAYAAMNGTPNIPHHPFQQTFVAYPANMVTTDDGESVIGSTLSQDSSNGFALPIVTAQTRGSPAPDGSSMQQIVKINHQNSDTTFAGGPQAQMMVAYPSGYICKTHDLSTNEVNPTRGEALFPGMQNQLGAANPMYALSGNSQPQQAASRLEVHMHTEAIQRLDLTAITQSRASSQPVAQAPENSRENGEESSRSLTSSLEARVKRGDKDNSRLTAIARAKPRARSALPGGSGYHGQISSSDGRLRTLDYVSSQNDASQVTSPPMPVNSETQSSVISQPSFQGSPYFGGNGIIGSQKPRTLPQAPSTSNDESRIGLPESLKSQRRSLPESVLPSSLPMRNLQLDHSWREPAAISSPNTHNLQRSLIRGGGLEQEALSAKLPSLPRDRYSDATVTPSKLDPDSNLVMGKLKSQVQRAVGQVEAVKDVNATGGLAAESANGVGIGMEIKETIERMLQYKNMHPTIFSKIWVQVKKDQGGQEIEVTGKSNALSNGDRNLNSPTSSQNHLGSRPELSIEPLQQGNLDVGSETTQRRKRKSSETVSRTSDPRRQRPDVVHSTPTPTIQHFFAGSTKSAHVERSIESPVSNEIPSPPGNSTSHRKLGLKTTTPKVTGAPIQGAPPPAGAPSTWSKEKKKALAQALRNKLASISGNASTAITTDEIIRTFNNTPSMAEVRRSLKDRGLNISAEDLFQWWCATLLKYDERTKNEQQSSKLEGPLHHNSKTAAPSNLNYDSMNGYAHNTSLNPAMPSLSDGHHHLNEIQKPPRSLPPSPMDGNTRKRSYTSVIDLTSEPSSAIIDGIQISRVGIEKTDDVNLRREKISSLSHADTAACYGKPIKILEQTANKRMKKSLADDKGKDLSHFEYAKSQQDLLHSNIIITPMDVKKALRRSTYNSDSIAKDVLVAAAKHPTEAPLNHHVDVLRNKFVYVNSRSDLSTFRWELVDPGSDEQNVPAARSRIADVDDTEEDLDPRKSASADRHQKEFVAANDRVVRAANADTIANQNARGRPPRQEKVMNQRFISTATQEEPSNTVVPVAYSDKSMITDKISKPNRQSAQQAPNGSYATSLARKPKGAANASPDPPHSTHALERRPQALSQGEVRFKPSFARPRDVRARSGSRVREASPVRLEQRMKARLPVSTQNSKPSRSNSLISRKSYNTPMRPSGLRNFLTPPDGIAVVIQSPPPKAGAVEKTSRR